MSLTNEEKLKTALNNGGIHEYAGMYVVFKTKKQFLAYTYAIEEKYQAENDRLAKQVSDAATMWTEQCAENEKYLELIGMLRNALEEVRPYFEGEHHPDHPACKIIRAAIDDAQATADAWEAEVKARAKLEGKIEVLREAYRRWNEHNNLSMTTIMENLLAELRNQAHPSVKLTQIYARQKEICQNCEQTMPEGCGGIFKRDGTACRLNAAQPAQTRNPCTCDGWCDGLCLEKEGKRK